VESISCIAQKILFSGNFLPMYACTNHRCLLTVKNNSNNSKITELVILCRKRQDPFVDRMQRGMSDLFICQTFPQGQSLESVILKFLACNRQTFLEVSQTRIVESLAYRTAYCLSKLFLIIFDTFAPRQFMLKSSTIVSALYRQKQIFRSIPMLMNISLLTAK
jgi:hypothetical protein